MIKTEEFIKKFSQSDIASIITKFFDEIMVLYNFIGYMDNITIEADPQMSTAVFVIKAPNEDEANRLYDSLNGKTFSIYERSFDIGITLYDKTIITNISETLSK